jgi:hypothetical protein
VREYEQRYRDKSVDDAIDEIVELRGFLHHHSARRPDTWHPEDHARFESEALLLSSIAMDVAFVVAKQSVFDAETVREYQEAFAGNAALTRTSNANASPESSEDSNDE